MILIDSSCWLEYFAGTENCKDYKKEIENIDNVLVPSIVIYEVCKKLLIETTEDNTIIAIAHMELGRVIDVDSELAISGARLSLLYQIPMADSIILAVAKKFSARLFTHDEHFSKIPDVSFIPKGQF